MKNIFAIALLIFSAAFSVAQNTLRVPDNYATIQDAVNAASPGDTILIGSGTWCGAVVTKRLFIRGEGQAAISGNGCSGPLSSAPLPAPGEVEIVGLLLQKSGTADPSGTVIEHLNFSDVYTAINALAINDVVVQHNTMQPQRVGVFSRRSSNWTVAYNKIDNRSALRPFRNSGIVNQVGSGWTVVHNEIVGTFLGVVLAGSALSRPTDNTISFNHIEGGCCDGAGIDFTAQDGTVITNNDISVPTSTDAVGSAYCGANGILVADASGLAAINSTIVNNDTRPTQVGVLIALNVNGNTGNAEGLLMRGNFGTLALNQSIDSCTSGAITGVVKNRSISGEITCDEDGACTEP